MYLFRTLAGLYFVQFQKTQEQEIELRKFTPEQAQGFWNLAPDANKVKFAVAFPELAKAIKPV